MRPGQDKRYAYAAGRIRVLESRLLNNAAMERLIEAQGADEEGFILKERGLSPSAHENLSRAYRVLDELSLDRRLAEAFRIKYDLHNLKIVLRARLYGMAQTGISGLGLFALEDIKKIAGKEKAVKAPFDYIGLIGGLERKKFYLMDFEIDKALIDYEMSVFSGYSFLKDYLKRYIDLKNIAFYHRLKNRQEILREALLPGGYLDRKVFHAGLETGAARLYERVAGPGLESFHREGSLDIFEKLSDDYLMDILRPAKFMPFGVEPLFGYCSAAESQAGTVDFILSAKRGGISREMIRRHLRQSYV